MCYSAQVESKWKRHVREMEAHMAWSDFRELAQLRLADPGKYRLPRGFDLEFAHPQTDEERAIKDLIDQHRKAQVTKLETEIFAQRKRQAEVGAYKPEAREAPCNLRPMWRLRGSLSAGRSAATALVAAASRRLIEVQFDPQSLLQDPGERERIIQSVCGITVHCASQRCFEPIRCRPIRQISRMSRTW